MRHLPGLLHEIHVLSGDGVCRSSGRSKHHPLKGTIDDQFGDALGLLLGPAPQGEGFGTDGWSWNSMKGVGRSGGSGRP